MSKFDYMAFSVDGGRDDEFVVHAKKFAKSEAVELLKSEYEYRFENGEFRTPTEDDFRQAHVRYFVRVPEQCGLDTDGGCYSYCAESERGSFPVWVCTLAKLVA